MTEVGFEPTPPKRLEIQLETQWLSESPWQGRMGPVFGYLRLFLKRRVPSDPIAVAGVIETMVLPEHGVYTTDRNGPRSRGAIFRTARDDKS